MVKPLVSSNDSSSNIQVPYKLGYAPADKKSEASTFSKPEYLRLTETTNDRIPYRTGYLPLNGVTIMVNPGHGAPKDIVNKKTHKKEWVWDEGAQYKLGKKTIKEANLNAQVAKDITRKLRKLGANVEYLDSTYVKEIPIKENLKSPDFFISIHHDAKPEGKNGDKYNSGETIYAHGETSLKAAGYINKHFKDDKTIPNNDYLNHEKIKHASELWVLKANPQIPAMLLEVGFMTNKDELKTFTTREYQDKAAQMTVEGIRDYFRDKKKEEMPTIEQRTRAVVNKITNPFLNCTIGGASGKDM